MKASTGHVVALIQILFYADLVEITQVFFIKDQNYYTPRVASGVCFLNRFTPLSYNMVSW